jgi:hypothetical protein
MTVIRRVSAAIRTAAAVVFVAATAPAPALADSPLPLPSESPQPVATAPTATPVPQHAKGRRLRVAVQSSLTYVNQQFVGAGIAPPEARAFAAGEPIAPGTPYDLWTSSPNVTGYGINHTLLITPVYAITPQYDIGATIGYGSISGSANVAAYWGDQTLATLNPHLGKHPAAVAFPAANAADAIAGAGSALLSLTLTRRDGRLAARAGWFDLAQGESFVFDQPVQTNTPMLFTEPLPEGIGDKPFTLPSLAAAQTRLPLYGLTLLASPRRDTSVELVDAELPEPPGTHARVLSGSLNVARSSRLSFGAQIARLTTGGAPIGTTVLFGANAMTTPSDQGPLPTSTLAAQRMTIAGLRADLPLAPHLDGHFRLGYSCYAATGTARPQGACTSGRYASASVRRTTDTFDLGLEAMHMDATYAPGILPYGTLENVWSPAYSWPGTWLKGTYQLVGNAMMGPNREGLRATTRFAVGGVETRIAYGVLRQLRLYDATNAYQTGFVEGFYLPQLDAGGTLGSERHTAVALIAHPRIADVEIDFTDIWLGRRGSPGHPQEAVGVDSIGATATFSRRFGTRVVGSLGAGRNAMVGAFDAATTNVDLAERVVFGGLQWKQNANWSYGVQYRVYSVSGMPTAFPGGAAVSPAYHGPQIMLEQRFRN